MNEQNSNLCFPRGQPRKPTSRYKTIHDDGYEGDVWTWMSQKQDDLVIISVTINNFLAVWSSYKITSRVTI